MKARYFLFLSMASIFMLGACSSDEALEPEEDDVCVNIEDDVLRDYCYREFDLDHSGKVSTAEAEVVVDFIEIDAFTTARKTVKSLKGIDVFRNLKGIILENAVLSDIEVLSSMYNLQDLALAKCEISNIDALYRLKNLRGLSLTYCDIPAIDGSQLSDLERFAFDGTSKSDLDFSKNYTLNHIIFYPQNPVTLYLPKEMEKHVLFSLNDIRVSIQYDKTEGCELELVEGNKNFNVVYK